MALHIRRKLTPTCGKLAKALNAVLASTRQPAVWVLMEELSARVPEQCDVNRSNHPIHPNHPYHPT